jgi:hypothetical protein
MVEQTDRDRRRAYMEQYPENAEYDYDYEKERRAHRRVNLIKWGLGLTGLGMLLFTGITMAILIVTPIWFRGLPVSEQVIWIGRVPFLETFKPTRVYSADTLPTAIVTDNGALALLATSVTSPTAVLPANGSLAIGGDPVTNTPAPLVPAPTSLLATNTPVLAPVTPKPTVKVTLAVQPTPTAVPTIPPPPPPTAAPAPSSYQINGYKHEIQQWNTCGPANLTQTLHLLGWSGKQEQVTDYVKPNREDRNVSPWELVKFVNDNLQGQGGLPFKAIWRVGGDLNLIKRLVASNFAVVLEKGSFVQGEGWMGHYLTIQGYDDAQGEFHTLDTWLGDRWEKYDDVDQRWEQFNRLYIVVFPLERERELAVLLGPNADEASSVQSALNKAREEANMKPDDHFAWFNLGTNYVMLHDYKSAVKAYDMAFTVGGGLPFRMLWYQFGPYEAYYNMGDFGQVIALAEATLGTSSDLEESHYWRGMALAAQGDTNGAAGAFERALRLNTISTPAQLSLDQVRNGTFQPPHPGT